MILLHFTCGSPEEATKISRHLLEKKLCACCVSSPAHSQYWWKGLIEETEETIVLAKTLEHLKQRAIDEITGHHSYETPCIITIPCETTKDYNDYLRGELDADKHRQR
ncbi:divalent-cation tolerance protein CutA [Candidatus Woesearchaeota archaeon]|nr:MAG: periplasmic divalent cation tolerance protein [archaeon GW2011_AR4]MBS3130142.1 divalent-cation tolerance protein CutA [Candidatus Woesearchaeota archaeon]HIH38973.1 divalent-cation tolerance protein CutA [Candidatus Woesearchaeota archaeon]HIH49000.1 divalent-cation tolerance protein CutA [Candidatus Woesearchaeota archaeon]HIJ04109.1 divalent-cation tolerance protein CutA [Candidatus Woesearchaeota archaeon]